MALTWIKCVLHTWLDGDAGHREHTLGFVIVICHDPCANERNAMAGTVDHGFLCCGGELERM